MTVDHPHAKRKSAFRSSRTERWLLLISVILFFGLLLVLLLGANMRRGLNHDEHQFIAGATLSSLDALLPYADFAYFHVPLLSLIYAVIYQFEPRLLLGARLLSTFLAWVTLALVFLAAYRRHGATRLRVRLLFAALAAGWMAALPLFTYTSGRAWNHDLPLLLLLLAFFIHSDTLVERHSPVWLGASGLMMGLASTARLSFALMIVPFLLVLWFYPVHRGRDRWLGVVAFLAGCLIGAIPTLILFANDPAAFLFGNLGYVRLNTEYYRLSGATTAMTLPGKLVYLLQTLAQPGSLIAPVVLIVGSWPLWRTLRSRLSDARARRPAHAKNESLFRYAFILLLLFFALVGALAATPSQPQYFYVLFPLIILGSVYAFTAWPARLRRRGMLFFSGAALTTILLAIPAYLPGLAVVFAPQEWYPIKVHERGIGVARLVGHGKVLTLSPIHPLEGKAEIYPEFATGPFGWRVAPLVDTASRQQFHLVAADDLETFLSDNPPRGIMVGLDNDDVDEEKPFVDYAQAHAYMPVPLPDEGTLWLSPVAVWRESIQLGGYSLPAQPVQPGEAVVLTLYLQNQRAIAENLNVLVRLVDANGVELLRDEGWPWGAQTSTWAIGEVWPDGHELNLPEGTTPGYYAIEVSFYDPSDLDEDSQPTVIGHLLVGDPVDGVPDRPAIAQLGEAIDLLAVEAPDGAVAGGDVTVGLTWRTNEQLDEDYTLFLHLLDEAGDLAAQTDRPPLDGFLPTTGWLPHMEVEDAILLPLPADLPHGHYRLIAGMYEPETFQRLPAVVAGQPQGDFIEVGTIAIE